MPHTIGRSPREDGYRMPGEYEPHAGTWMLWPTRTDTWRLGAKPAQDAFVAVAAAIAEFEPVTIGVASGQFEHVRSRMPESVRVVEISSNDAWMRDIGPTFVLNREGGVRGIDWGFNAWGGLNGGLYFPWDQDLLVKQKVLEIERLDRYDLQHFILEGGSVHVDGEGTLITTEQCLLHKNRNPQLSKAQIEAVLRNSLNIDQIIWLPRGMLHDETDGHVDEVAAFVRPGVVVMSWTDNRRDPQYEVLNEAYKHLSRATDAQGRRLDIHKLQLPQPLEITGEEAGRIDRASHSYSRRAGTLLAASYVNFYICNGGVIMPGFGDRKDAEAYVTLSRLFPERKVVQINTREIALGGGNIHCITQQQPKGQRIKYNLPR
ncbi:agmatine deiminase [Paenibacillus tianjinensis]|uniref:Putative agmatine deiminase n=1 Tax=Paenibacillus tianjinensis TaxID=2810347 RepID=A0ABX7LCA9_9BACL|nr:agmatine deiminase [Paenibacillus tianjinensis]QSF45777.1 agmatine deiminase [Paenibacillus tianjinensis]